MREVFATPQFRKDLRKIPSDFLLRIDQVMRMLRENPLHPHLDLKKLVRIHPPAWRVRVGSYRLIYSFTAREVVLYRIRHRKDIYESM